jgi:hypothetical protein
MTGLQWLEPFDTSSAVVFLRDGECCVLWVNREFTRVTGLTGEAVIGRHLPAAPGLPDQSRAASVIKQVIRRRRIFEEINGLTLDNVNRWFDCRHTPVGPELTAGKGWCVLTNAVEITAQVQLAALGALLGLRARRSTRRKAVENDEAFVRLLLRGTTIHDLSTGLGLSVDEVTGRLAMMAGTPLR